MIQSSLSSLSTSPFFSSIITLYTLLLLYLPSFLLPILSSPVFFFTFILLLHLLRLGATQKSSIKSQLESSQHCTFTHPISKKLDFLKHEENVAEQLNSEKPTKSQHQSSQDCISTPPISKNIDFDQNLASKLDLLKHQESVTQQLNAEKPINENSNSAEPNSDNLNSENSENSANSEKPNSSYFVEWDLRAPLEVIYEEEGQYRETQMEIIEKYASLSKFYPDLDTDSSSSELDFPVAGEVESPENDGFLWDEEEGEGLIEIELHGKGKMEVEEENLIEIDLSPAR